MLQTPSEVIDTQKEAMIPSESKIRRKIKAVRQEESSLTCQRVDPFVLFRPSADWMGPTILGKAICIIFSLLILKLISL